MTGPVPTRDGDVMIAAENASAVFAVWTVGRDGQQEPDADTYVSAALGRPGAKQLAFLMAREMRGSVFFLERQMGTWTKLT